jgi:competence protein ComEC
MAQRWRIDPMLVVVSCGALGAFACVDRVATLGVAMSCLLFWRTHLPRRALAGALLALCTGWARASWLIDRFEAARAQALDVVALPTACAVRGRVLGSPALHGGVLQFDAQLEEIDCEGRQAARPVRARLLGAPANLARGDEFSAIAKLLPVSAFRNFALPDPIPALARQGVVLRGTLLWFEPGRVARGLSARIDQLRASARARIEATFAPAARAMARALVLGESDLDPADDAAFRKSGLSHLLAVSGTHLVFAVLGVLRGLEALLRRWSRLAVRWDVRRLAALIGLALAPLYADFSGGSGSAWRAAFMLLAVLGARALGRHAFSSRVIALSLALGWLGDGLVVFDPSFLLSLAATLGLLLVGEITTRQHGTSAAELAEPRRVELGKLLARISSAAVTSVAACLPCLPILLLLSPGLSLASVAANLLAGPLGEIVALPLCLTHVLAGPWPALERGLGLVASGALLVLREIARVTASIDWLYFELPPPGAWHIASVALGVAGLLGLRGVTWLPAAGSAAAAPARSALRRWCAPLRHWCAPLRRWCAPLRRWSTPLWLGACASLLVGVELAVRREYSAAHGRELGRLRVTALDVGQGDATLIDLPDGRLMLIDAGGLPGSSLDIGARVLLPILRARRRSRIDLLVLSHPHPDHYGGLAALSEGVSIGEFWYAPEAGAEPGELSGLLARVRHRAERVRATPELCEQGVRAPGYTIEVLAPCPGPVLGRSANDNSLVLRIRTAAGSALFVGDAERWAEARLLESHPGELRADFLKVGHHGSRSSSSPEFIARVRPAVATISCGAGNRFGHPHAETLATLRAAGTQILRLDQSGSVEWQASGNGTELRTFVER